MTGIHHHFLARGKEHFRIRDSGFRHVFVWFNSWWNRSKYLSPVKDQDLSFPPISSLLWLPHFTPNTERWTIASFGQCQKLGKTKIKSNELTTMKRSLQSGHVRTLCLLIAQMHADLKSSLQDQMKIGPCFSIKTTSQMPDTHSQHDPRQTLTEGWHGKQNVSCQSEDVQLSINSLSQRKGKWNLRFQAWNFVLPR